MVEIRNSDLLLKFKIMPRSSMLKKRGQFERKGKTKRGLQKVDKRGVWEIKSKQDKTKSVLCPSIQNLASILGKSDYCVIYLFLVLPHSLSFVLSSLPLYPMSTKHRRLARTNNHKTQLPNAYWFGHKTKTCCSTPLRYINSMWVICAHFSRLAIYFYISKVFNQLL